MYLHLFPSNEKDVLILGAGTGRVALALADAGFQVWGVDNSEGMLTRARQKVRDRPNLKLVQADMTSLYIGRRFDVVLVPFDAFTSLPDQAAQIGALQRARAHLLDEGALVVDVVNPLVLPPAEQLPMRRLRFEAMDGERKVTAYDSASIDQAEQVMIMTVSYERASRSRRRRTQVEVPVRWIYRFELEALMRLAALHVTHVYGDYDLSSYDEESPRLIMLAEPVATGVSRAPEVTADQG
jgi:SAM-dependent methyltransferase